MLLKSISCVYVCECLHICLCKNVCFCRVLIACKTQLWKIVHWVSFCASSIRFLQVCWFLDWKWWWMGLARSSCERLWMGFGKFQLRRGGSEPIRGVYFLQPIRNGNCFSATKSKTVECLQNAMKGFWFLLVDYWCLWFGITMTLLCFQFELWMIFWFHLIDLDNVFSVVLKLMLLKLAIIWS